MRFLSEKALCLFKLFVHLLRNSVQVSCFRSLCRVWYNALCNKVPKLPRVGIRQRWIVALLDIFRQHQERHLLAVEWRIQSCHLVQHAPQRPDIGLKVVRVLLNAFRRKVVWCTHFRCSASDNVSQTKTQNYEAYTAEQSRTSQPSMVKAKYENSNFNSAVHVHTRKVFPRER